MENWLYQSDIIASVLGGSTNYPPYNIKRKGGDIVIEVATAGFSKDELRVIEEGNTGLIVRGEKKLKEQKEVFYNHKGISSRTFERRFTTDFNTRRISEVKYTDGILSITLEQIVPKKLNSRELTIL